jgi:membrane protein DedA with SNARE-associated domain
VSDLVIHVVETYGYAGIFSLLMLGILGIPLPDELLLGFCGYLIFREELSPLPTLLAAFLGSICGVTGSYLIGRFLGSKILDRYGYLFHLTPARIQRVDSWFARFGKWILPLGYFLPGIRHLTAYVAGSSRLDARHFALYSFSGGLLWCLLFLSLGYYLGKDWSMVILELRGHLILATIGLLLSALVATAAITWWRKKHR